MAITRTELIRILAEADPAGLIAQGAPADEYAREADEIITIKDPGAAEIGEIFAASFSEPGICTRATAVWILDQMRERDRPE